MPKHAAPATRSPWRPLVLAVAAAVALVSSSAGVFALLRAQAAGTQAVSTGTLRLTLTSAPTSFGTAITDAAPGDTFRRFVTLNNPGTLVGTAPTLTMAQTALPAPSTGPAPAVFPTNAVTVQIHSCPGTWSTTTGDCSGGTAAQLASGDLVGFGTRSLSPLALPVGGSVQLRVSLLIGGSDEVITNGVIPSSSPQGKGANLTFTFTQDQRAAATSSS